MVPTSLLTSITDTTTVALVERVGEVVEVDDAVGADRHARHPEALGLEPVCGRASTPLCSNAVVTTPSPPPAAAATRAAPSPRGCRPRSRRR